MDRRRESKSDGDKATAASAGKNGAAGQRDAVEVDETFRSIEISGIKSFLRAQSRAAKVFWLILLLASTTILIWQLYKTVDNYINSPIVSTYTIATVPEMVFPIVYICPTSLVSNLHLNSSPESEAQAIRLKREIGVVWDYVKFLSGSANLSEPFDVRSIDGASHVVPAAFKNMVVNNKKNIDDESNSSSSSSSRNHSSSSIIDDHIDMMIDPEHFFKNVTTPLDGNVRHCEFRSFLFETIPCENITREVFDPEYGKCYVVDVGQQRKQAVQSQGLLLVFNVQSKWYPKQSALSPLFNGVMVGVERAYNVRGSGERVFVKASSYNRIDLAVQRQQFKSFQNPYPQQCTESSEDASDDGEGLKFEYEIFNVNYTQRSCAYDCVARQILRNCRCVPPVDRSLYKDDVFNDTTTAGVEFCMGRHLGCIEDRVHRNATAAAAIQECRESCRVPCTDWRYDVRVTTMDLYEPAFESFQYVPDITYVLVAYSHMEYTQFTQDDSTTVDEFIANIGGEVGLWLGASMMTLIQLPLSIITLCGLCCVKRAKKTAGTVVRRMSMAPSALQR